MKYWNETGIYSKLFSAIWDLYVPDSGECDNPIAEAVRCYNRIVYETFNNGCCNMFEEDDDGYLCLDDFYGDLFGTIRGFLSVDERYTVVDDAIADLKRLYNEMLSVDDLKSLDELGDAIGRRLCDKIEGLTPVKKSVSL
jgi:hypothetical protein